MTTPKKPFASYSPLTLLFCSLLVGGVAGAIASALVVLNLSSLSNLPELGFASRSTSDRTSAADQTVRVVERASPAVVSIIISKDLPRISDYRRVPLFDDPLFQQFFGNGSGVVVPNQEGSERAEIGGGSGFIVSADGYIVTNKHVVFDGAASYSVLLNDERTFDARVIGVDPTNDLAVLKIEATNLPTLSLGNSDALKLGQAVIAIGNALGEFRNTVSTGVVSGLARSITAGGIGFEEDLSGVIQTDAAINSGNSGGPLLNLQGEVIGINTAVAQGAQNIGFAVPINDVKIMIDRVTQQGRFIRAFLGVRYIMLTPDIAKANNLSITDGALVSRGQRSTDLAVMPGSPADKAGIVENDIITEIDGQKLTTTNSLSKVIARHQPGDILKLTILHRGEVTTVLATLTEASQ
jgi:serine protease Do